MATPAPAAAGPCRKTRRKVNQNAGPHYCWATCHDTLQPCEQRVQEGSALPYCKFCLETGDGAIEVVDHPTNKVSDAKPTDERTNKRPPPSARNGASSPFLFSPLSLVCSAANFSAVDLTSPHRRAWVRS